MKPQFNLDAQLFEEGARLLRAINNKVRQKKLHIIHRKGKISVGELKDALKLEQSAASLHLAILRNEELVIAERDGQNIYYSINYDRLQKVQALLKEMLASNDK